MAVQLELTETEKLITGQDALAVGDIGRFELVEGRIVLMSPTGFSHGKYEIAFGQYVRDFVRSKKLGQVATGEVGIYIRHNPDTVRAADVAFISHERYARQEKKSGYLDVAPELVVEIMSPDDRWNDVTQKLREYFAIGVRLVWVADPATRTVYAYRSLTDVREFSQADTLPGDDVLPGFSVPIVDLFEE